MPKLRYMKPTQPILTVPSHLYRIGDILITTNTIKDYGSIMGKVLDISYSLDREAWFYELEVKTDDNVHYPILPEYILRLANMHI